MTKLVRYSLFCALLLGMALGCDPDALPPAEMDDASVADGGTSDSGSVDAGEIDAGEMDAGESDAGETDVGASDTGASDTGASDTGDSDTGDSDTGDSDTGDSEPAPEPPPSCEDLDGQHESNIPAGVTVYYEEHFDEGDGGWTVNSGDLWEHGQPCGHHIRGAASARGAWTTRLEGAVPPSELECDTLFCRRAEVVSPPIDLSEAEGELIITMSIHRDIADAFADGAYITVGNSRRLFSGAMGAGVNWYNRALNLRPAQDSWTGTQEEWVTVKFRLFQYERWPDARVTVVYQGDHSTGEGFAFDDVVIRQATEPDLQVHLAQGHGNEGTVVAYVQNQGEAPALGTTLEMVFSDGTERTVNMGTLRLGEPAWRGFDVPDGIVTAAVSNSEGEADPSDNSDSWDSIRTVPMADGDFLFDDFEGETQWHSNDFRRGGGPDGLIPTGSWEQGLANGAALTSDSTVWATNLDGLYGYGEISSIEGPNIDASALSSDLVVSFDLFTDLADAAGLSTRPDRAELQVTFDRGHEWFTLATFYGESGGFESHEVIAEGTAGERYVRFRFALYADSFVQAEGIAVDNVRIAAE